jgi:hypothetical protein
MSTLLLIRAFLIAGVLVGLALLLLKKGRQVHPRWMVTMILLDLGLLAYVIVARQPLQKSLGLAELHTSGVGLALHVITALGLLVSYTLTWRLGRAASRSRKLGRACDLSPHRIMGASVVMFLLVNYATTPGFIFDWMML